METVAIVLLGGASCLLFVAAGVMGWMRWRCWREFTAALAKED